MLLVTRQFQTISVIFLLILTETTSNSAAENIDASFLSTQSSTNHFLKCYSTLSPNEYIICPEDRNNFCVKEVVSSSRKECGMTNEYPNDIWDRKEPGGACVYRKCATSCSNSTTFFVGRREEKVSRTSYCCDKNLCNSGIRIGVPLCLAFVAACSIIVLLS